MLDVTSELKNIFSERLKENESLSKHTTWRIGGPARWFVEAKKVEEVIAAIKIVKEAGVKYFVLGGGSNILVDDNGFDGLVIQLALREVKVEGNKVFVGAGLPAVLLARTAAGAGLSGLEWMAALPGTVGGAVRGNAGCFGGETKDYLLSVSVLHEGSVAEMPKDILFFGYRDSVIKKNKDIVLSAVFELVPGDLKTIKEKMGDLLTKRLASQPPAGGTAGCVFKNYIIKDGELDRLKQEFDLPLEMIEKKIISVGWLIEQMDFKGKQIGGAKVSEKHANFIENVNGATASDVVQLIAMIKMKARDQFGIQLEEEVEYLV